MTETPEVEGMAAKKLDELEGGIANLERILSSGRNWNDRRVLAVVVGVLQYAKDLEARITKIETHGVGARFW